MTCASFLQPFVDWINTVPQDENRYLNLMLVSNDKEGPARYAEGRLYLKTYPPSFPFRDFFVGEADLYESNERWGLPPLPGQFGVTPYPFAPANDSILVQINVTTGSVTLTSDTKGRAILDNPQCADSLLFGFATSGHGALGVAGFQRLSPALQAAVAESDVQNAGGNGPGTGPTHPGPWPFKFLRPYYVLSFKQEVQTIPH